MTVHLVGAGPGDPDLLTVRAARLLGEADAVVYDRLVAPDVLALAPRGAELIDVGKLPGHEDRQVLINDLLVSLGRRHATVVRLKGGDPFVFGRGFEELEALAAAGVDCSVVPGLSSSLSAPLAAGIPVTHRSLARGVVVVTGHGASGDHLDFAALAGAGLTLVVLMGVARRGPIARELLAGGLGPATPVAAVHAAFTAAQRVVRGRLDGLAELDVTSPAVLVIGAVAGLRSETLCELAAGALSER